MKANWIGIIDELSLLVRDNSQVERNENNQDPVQTLAPGVIPTLDFQNWVVTVLWTTQVSHNVILLGLMFIYQLKQSNSAIKGKSGSKFRLLTIALMLGNKSE